MKFSPRMVYGAGVLACIALLATALYMQHVMKLEPCPLCVFQRIVVIGLGLLCLAAAVHHPASVIGQRVYAVIAAVISLVGAGIAGRHVWLQHLPEGEVPACGPGFDYVWESFPLFEALSVILKGSGECAKVVWQFLGLSIPEWTLIVFGGFFLVSLWLFFCVRGDAVES